MAKTSGTTKYVGSSQASAANTSREIKNAKKMAAVYEANAALAESSGHPEAAAKFKAQAAEEKAKVKAATQPKVSLSQISVSDSSYRMALGRVPRGTGNWAFSIGSREAFNDVTKAFWHNGSYTEAVRAAKKEAQKRGKTIVYVMS